uniref:Uncharacterized protein n=1 Tax=Ditylum brightwellii TaxID=49249 RepID=A0A6U3WGL3_9STRA|mmetsp:Transcript_15271/g.20225  ORF Transcript_15271/g.20225 Transcript_15271/m.20225 type:complete len:214 (+) Transcript_15271:128-769(+)|eukprot:5010872-Ditylum_brightwellii.AAC.1
MCLFCFSGDKLESDEAKGKYGAAYGKYADNEEKFDITMCQAPCSEPGCYCASMLCFVCAQVHLRKKALNHLNPGSGWSDYLCCQGVFGGCCCLQPGNMGEQSCPCCCMCLEACACPGMAISASRAIIMDRYNLGLDEDDVRLIRCNNCLQILALCASCLNICIDFEGDDLVVGIINAIADIVFFCVSGCMTAQVNREINKRGTEAPQSNAMTR